MKNIMKSISGLILLLSVMFLMNGCKTEIQYVEKTYTSEVVFTTADAGENGVTITMTTATEGAVIYYTTDGSTPTTASTKYSEAITLSPEVTIKAIAVKKGLENSPVSSVRVSRISGTVNIVTKYICPNCKKEYNTAEEAEACCESLNQGKNYTAAVTFTTEDLGSGSVKITMVCTTEDAAIYYTTDGSTPTAESTRYSEAVTLSTDITVKAIAAKEGFENSPVASVSISKIINTVTNTVTKYLCSKCKKEYTTAEAAADCCGVEYQDRIYAAAVTIKIEDAASDSVKISMACTTEGAVIYYTTDGSMPQASSTEYLSPITLNENKTIKAVAVKSGMENSPVTVTTVKIRTVINTKTEAAYPEGVPAGRYTIYHLQQKTNGGKSYADYNLIDTDSNKTVAENAKIDDMKKTYAGFTAKSMAKNENVIYIFYDRNLITYYFATGQEGYLADGTRSKNIVGLYGAPVPAPMVSSSTHNFSGWYTSEGKAIEPVYGLEDLAFSVKWTQKAEGVLNWYESPVDAGTGEAATSSSAYVYFGVFPNTVLPEDSSVTVNEDEKVTQGANTYYKGSDDNWYAKVTENASESNYKYSDNSSVKEESAGSTRYFKVEPIKWKVHTTNYNGKNLYLLVATEIVTGNVPYYVSHDSRFIGGNTVDPNNYKYSTVRAYLNGKYEADDRQREEYTDKGFLQTAFTNSAQIYIQDTELSNENTTDKLFLLSLDEVSNSSYGFNDDSTRIRYDTDYAKANKAYQNINSEYKAGVWWLRTPYKRKDGTYFVNFVYWYGGPWSDGTYVNSWDFGIVPALTITFSEI